MQQTGIEALWKDSDFQAGLARYMSGLGRAENATRNTANTMTTLGHTISTALGTAIGTLAARVIPDLIGAMAGPINMVRSWGEQLDSLGDIFGLTDQAGAGFAIAMKKVGISVEEGTSSFSYFSRQVSDTKNQLTDAAETFSTATGEIAASHADAVNRISADWQSAQSEAASNIASIWSELAERKAEIESGLAEQIASINESLTERLQDIAEERGKVERDTAKNLAKLEAETKDRLASAHSLRERRQIRKDAAQRKQELLDQAAERKAELDKQEAREKAQAARQIATAERVAQKQIEAAEKAAQKQTEAIEKAMAKQEAAMRKQMEDADKAAAKQFAAAQKALGGVQDKSPLSRALKALGLDFARVTDEGRPFEDRLGDIMDAFAKLPEGIDASAVAIQLFGRAGIKWIDFLRLGRAGLQEAKQLGIELGLILDPREAEEYGRSLNILQLGFDALGINIGKVLLPYAKDFALTLTDMLRNGVPLINDLLARLSAGFKTGGFGGIVDAFAAWVNDPKMQARLQPILQKFSDLIGSVLGGIFQVGQAVGNAMGWFITTVQTWASDPKNQPIIQAAMNAVGTALANALNVFIQTSTAVASVMATFCGKLIEWISSREGQAWMQAVAGAFVSGFASAIGNAGLANAFWAALGHPFGLYGKGYTPESGGGGGGGIGGFQNGGWVRQTGPALVHAGEYVLTRQQAMAWAPALSRPNTTTNVYQFSHTWNGPASSFDRREIEGYVDTVVYRNIRKVVKGA